jgi:hypothetical protein
MMRTHTSTALVPEASAPKVMPPFGISDLCSNSSNYRSNSSAANTRVEDDQLQRLQATYTNDNS